MAREIDLLNTTLATTKIVSEKLEKDLSATTDANLALKKEGFLLRNRLVESDLNIATLTKKSQEISDRSTSQRLRNDRQSQPSPLYGIQRASIPLENINFPEIEQRKPTFHQRLRMLPDPFK